MQYRSEGLLELHGISSVNIYPILTGKGFYTKTKSKVYISCRGVYNYINSVFVKIGIHHFSSIGKRRSCIAFKTLGLRLGFAIGRQGTKLKPIPNTLSVLGAV